MPFWSNSLATAWTRSPRLSASRTPVRRAIRLLADQGLVETRANRRSYVADVNEAQFEELFDSFGLLDSALQNG